MMMAAGSKRGQRKELGQALEMLNEKERQEGSRHLEPQVPFFVLQLEFCNTN